MGRVEGEMARPGVYSMPDHGVTLTRLRLAELQAHTEQSDSGLPGVNGESLR